MFYLDHDNWHSYSIIVKLLNSEPTVSQTDDYEEEEDINESLKNEELEPSRVEIEMVIKSLKNNKAAEEDWICGELLKLGGPRLTDELYNLISKIWHTEEIPIEWRTSIICPILKKGDPKCVENYRGISLLDVGYKVLATFLLKRIQDISERVIGEY
jgi:hypothetical protein